MSKTWRNILILVCVVALLVGALVTVLLLPPPDSTEDDTSNTDPSGTGTTSTTAPADKTVTLIELKKGDDEEASLIRSAKITTKTFGTFTVKADDKGVLIVDGQQDLPREEYQYEDLEKALIEIVAQRLITENGAAEEFGFDDPQASFEIAYVGGKTLAFDLGDMEPFETGRYLRIKGESKVYLAEVDFLDKFALNPLSYIKTDVIESPEAEAVDENTGAEVDVVLRDMELSGTFYGKDGLAFRLASEVDSTEMQASHYVLTKPYIRNSNGNVLTEAVMSSHSLTAEIAVVARYTDKELKEYGLDNPYLVAKFHTASRKIMTNEDKEVTTTYKNVQEHTVLLSKPSNGYYYVLVDDYKSIYRVAASQLPWAELTYSECVLPTLFLKSITTVKELRYTVNGKLHAFKLTHYPEKEDDPDLSMVVNLDGEQYNTKNFRNLYQVMMALARFGETDETPSGTPEIVIEVVGNDGVNEKMEIYYASASTYIVKDKSGDTYTVRNSRVKNLMRQVDNFLNGKTVSILE